MTTVADVTAHLGGLGMAGDAEGMLRAQRGLPERVRDRGRVVDMALAGDAGEGGGWRWRAGYGGDDADFYEGKVCAAEYWIATELPKVEGLVALCRMGEGSYARMREEWF